jgi:glucose-6-phosphate 1-dehydrogenase
MTDSSSKQLDPAILVIFGITGDLSQRYLLPALYNLVKANLLHQKTVILGVTRGQTGTQELIQKVEQAVNRAENSSDPATLQNMSAKISMFQMNLDDASAYAALLAKLNEIEENSGVCMNRLYYLSIPPSAHLNVIGLMGAAGLNKSCLHDKADTRLLVEKPFGLNLASAEKLIAATAQNFSEAQTFRIDHYVAKETVQNILTFRFKNPIFEPIWNREHVSAILISAKEKIGIEGRAVFYDPLGALRDFIQSHLVQIMGLITMDRPEHLDSDHIHGSKQAALDQIEAVPTDRVLERVVRGQYEGYKQEVDNNETVTETFVGMTVYSQAERWRGVPITLLTGKSLDERKTEIRVTFSGEDKTISNELRFRIQPNEGIELDLVTKRPGYSDEVQTTPMDFSYEEDFKNHGHPNAYERVLVDAVRGDHTLFATSQEILASWRIVQPILDEWANGADDLRIYPPGSEGPKLPENAKL